MCQDLRTPMNAIKGYSEMLLENLDDLNARHLEADLLGLLGHPDALLKQIVTRLWSPPVCRITAMTMPK
ncbi:histidine kinase dimerization/phospho-acceptor domain-containing protein [Ruegeria arenilitoris]|uniref:histidine kinase dimerization/phospho-acceptor domain-containing protein n=1 Tax=Ruegeria arenilitoris TaxID=1173585 RepID=UPI00346445D8